MAAEMEPPLGDDPVDLLLVDPSRDVADPEPPARTRRVIGPYLGHRPEVYAAGSDEERARTRRRLDLPDGPLVVGWGSDGWVDGPDVFIRALWALARRGSDAHGVWFGLGADPHELDRLASEAVRCGVADRMHFRPNITREARLCGNAVFNCDRSPGGRTIEQLVEAIIAGSPVVSFPTLEMFDEDIRFVPMLDVEAASVELERLVSPDGIAGRPERRRAARVRLDVCGSFEELFARRRDGA
jgi:hypothetical protein